MPCGAPAKTSAAAPPSTSSSTRVRAAPSGARSRGQIAHYASASFIGDKIEWAFGQLRSKEAQLAAREQAREAQRRREEDEAPRTLDEARAELTRVLDRVHDDGLDYLDMRAEYLLKRDAVYSAIDAELDDQELERRERDRERDKRRTVERRRLKATLAKEFGFREFPVHAPTDLFTILTGIGKSTAIRELLAKLRGGRIEVFVPTHKLLGETAEKLRAMNPHLPVYEIRGRKADDPEGRLVGKAGKWKSDEGHMCARHVEAAAVSAAGLSVKSALCAGCPLRTHCG